MKFRWNIQPREKVEELYREMQITPDDRAVGRYLGIAFIVVLIVCTAAGVVNYYDPNPYN